MGCGGVRAKMALLNCWQSAKMAQSKCQNGISLTIIRKIKYIIVFSLFFLNEFSTVVNKHNTPDHFQLFTIHIKFLIINIVCFDYYLFRIRSRHINK